MASYCTRTKLTDNLPSSLPSSMDNDYLDGTITDASAELDELVGWRYARSYKTNTQKFPDISDDPATPKTIEMCALWLALSRCYEKLETENIPTAEQDDLVQKTYWRNRAEKKLAEVAAGKIDLSDSILPTDDVETFDRYLEATTEDDKEWKNKYSELDRLYP